MLNGEGEIGAFEPCVVGDATMVSRAAAAYLLCRTSAFLFHALDGGRWCYSRVCVMVFAYSEESMAK
jgi:hypothetical protein